MIRAYLKTISEVVKTFVKSFDEDYDARMGKEFCACLNENTIEWTLIYSADDGQEFYDNFVARYPIAEELDTFTLSILHEIGHLETEDEIIDDTKDRRKKLTNAEYFELFNEKIATDWAGEWIEENYNLAVAFEQKVLRLLAEMYKNNLD